MVREIDGFLSDQPLWIVGLVLLIALLVAREFGGWLRPRKDDSETADEALIVSGVLGLLALLVAFTFSLALSRYEHRRDLVIQEANAIGTAYARIQLLDQPDRGRLSAMMLDYAKARQAFGDAAAADRPTTEQRSEALQAPLWRATAEALRPIRTTAMASLVASSVNSVLDMEAERKASLAARLPPSVLQALLLYSLGSAIVVGYALARMGGGGHRAAGLLLFGLLALAITLILDLDRPRSGSIQVPQDAMRQAVAGLPALTAP